jgi:hypothetical protein
MNLNDYQWSNNPRGMHGPGVNHQLWDQWKLGWIKTTYEDNTALDQIPFMLEKGMTPIVRIYRSQLSGRPMDEAIAGQYMEHIRVGARWFEFYNEPNLPYEWPPGTDINHNNQSLIEQLCENWLPWAEFIASNGSYPGFIALSETTESWGETTKWMMALLRYMHDRHYERFRNIINSGFWIPVHNYIVNHWYQEVPGGGPLSARQPHEVNHAEGGWHYEYPYDPICQADDPGRTVWGGTPSQPANDLFSVLGGGIAWLELLQEMFGVGWVPVVGTEGGIWRLPDASDPTWQQDNRYPAYDINSHAHGTVAMFDWIADHAPGWMFGVTLWRYEDYWRGNNPIPALNLLSATNTRMKTNIPNYPALGDAPPPYDANLTPEQQVAQQPTPEPPPQPTSEVVSVSTPVPVPTQPPPGPGPIHGSPSLHFLMLAPGLTYDWFFSSVAARQYWMRFQPVLMTNIDFINFLPFSTSLAVTTVNQATDGDPLRDLISTTWRNVWIDSIMIDSPAALDEVFRIRVENGLRFV